MVPVSPVGPGWGEAPRGIGSSGWNSRSQHVESVHIIHDEIPVRAT